MGLVELGLQRREGSRRADPAPVGSPVCAMKPGMTRWKVEAVVELLLYQRLDLRDVLGRPIRAKLDRNVAVLRR